MCVCNVWTDSKLRWSLILLIFYYSRGSPGSRGGRWSTKTPPRDPCKRTCGTVVVHLGTFKSQLVATIVSYIYISFLVARFWDSVADGSLQWSSSILVRVNVYIHVHARILAVFLYLVFLSYPRPKNDNCPAVPRQERPSRVVRETADPDCKLFIGNLPEEAHVCGTVCACQAKPTRVIPVAIQL